MASLGFPLWDWQGAPCPLPLHTLSLFFLDKGCGWQWALPSTLILTSGGGNKKKYGWTPGTSPALGLSVTKFKSSVASV